MLSYDECLHCRQASERSMYLFLASNRRGQPYHPWGFWETCILIRDSTVRSSASILKFSTPFSFLRQSQSLGWRILWWIKRPQDHFSVFKTAAIVIHNMADEEALLKTQFESVCRWNGREKTFLVCVRECGEDVLGGPPRAPKSSPPCGRMPPMIWSGFEASLYCSLNTGGCHGIFDVMIIASYYLVY